MYLPFQTSSKHYKCAYQYLLKTFHCIQCPWGISTDEGSQFTRTSFQNFLKQWKIYHWCSSVAYPQSNGWAEVAVKTSRRIIWENISPDGMLNKNKLAAAILEYCNTPLEGINVSPVQILFHWHLWDSLHAHQTHYKLHVDWLETAKKWQLQQQECN